MRVSILYPVLNQSDELRMTIQSAKEGIGDMPHEIIVVDDQTIDNSTRDLPRDVIIIRNHRRLGCSGSRQVLQKEAAGDVLVWSDPHCRYPVDGLKKMAQAAYDSGVVVIPQTWTGVPGAKIAVGALYGVNERGLILPKAVGKAHPVQPGLIGTVYVVRKDVWDKVHGWPLLPGAWGCSDTIMSVLLWIGGIETRVVRDVTCIHKYSADRRFSFSVTTTGHATNAHWMHKALFPETYETYWRPLLLKHPKWGQSRVIKAVDRRLKGKDFAAFCEFVKSVRLPDRTEAAFYRDLLRRKPENTAVPVAQVPVDAASKVAAGMDDPNYAAYVAKQDEIAQPREHEFVKWERVQALNWLAEQNGSVKLDSVLDVGPRDGFIMTVLKQKGAVEVKGIEISASAVEYAKSKGLDVVQGDVRQMPYQDGSFDLVTCLHVLEHCPEPEKGMAEMWRCVKPGGWLYVVVPRQSGVNGHRRGAHYSYFPREKVVAELMSPYKPEFIRTGTGVIKNGIREIRMAARKATG